MPTNVNVASSLGGIKLILNGYKNLYKQYIRHGTTRLHKEALLSMRKTIRYEVDDMLNRNLFFDYEDTKKTFNMDHFQPKASEDFKKKVLENSYQYKSEAFCEDIKVDEELTLKTENYELLTDINLLAHAYERNLDDRTINTIIFKKNKRHLVFGKAHQNETLLKRLKSHLDIAEENRHYVPKHFESYFKYYLDFLKCQYEALFHPLLEVQYPATHTKIIPYRLRKQSNRLLKSVPVKLDPLEIHKIGILRLQHIIDRLNHGPSVRVTSFQSPLRNIYYCIPATDKNKPADNIFTMYYERARYQSHIWEKFYHSTTYALLPEVKNAYFPEINESIKTDGDFEQLFDHGSPTLKDSDSLKIYNDIRKQLVEERSKNSQVLSTQEMSLVYIDAYERDYQNLLKLKAKYDKLDVEGVHPFVKEKELMYQLIQNDLIYDITTYSSLGFVLYRLLKHVKYLHIRYYHDQIE